MMYKVASFDGAYLLFFCLTLLTCYFALLLQKKKTKQNNETWHLTKQLDANCKHIKRSLQNFKLSIFTYLYWSAVAYVVQILLSIVNSEPFLSSFIGDPLS